MKELKKHTLLPIRRTPYHLVGDRQKRRIRRMAVAENTSNGEDNAIGRLSAQNVVKDGDGDGSVLTNFEEVRRQQVENRVPLIPLIVTPMNPPIIPPMNIPTTISASETLSSRKEDLNKFQKLLASTVIQSRMNHKQVTAILKVLKSWKSLSDLPGSARTLLHTPRKAPEIRSVPPGEYLHFGLDRELEIIIQKQFEKDVPSVLQVDLFTDGGRLNKKNQVYPILCRIVIFKKKSKIGIVGIYAGKKSPYDFTEFLHLLVEDVKRIKEMGGITFQNRTISIIFRCFLGDAPIRAKLLNQKHTGSERPCSRCKVTGVYYVSWDTGKPINYLVYRGSSHPRRTLQEYYERADQFHYFPETPSVNQILSNPPLDVPLDYMHLILLGVTQKLLSVWMNGKYNRHEGLSRLNKLIAMRRFSVLSAFLSDEYARRPYDLTEFDSFKATEYRQILLVTGIIVFRGVLRDYTYTNFLFLHSAIRCLCYYPTSQIHLKFAELALKKFVAEAEDIYTLAFMSYNVHASLHLVDDVRRYGCSLDEISAFPFENVMGQFAKIVGKPALPLQQIFNRVTEIQLNLDSEPIVASEQPRASKKHLKENLSPEYTQFAKLTVNGFTYRTQCPNNFVFIDNQVHVIRNIVEHDGSYFVHVRKFRKMDPFYDVGISSQQVGVFLVSQLSETVLIYPIESIKNKCFLVPFSKVYDQNEPTGMDSSDDESVFDEYKGSYIVILM